MERATAILRLLAGSPARLGLGDIAASLGLAKATAHGIVRTLHGVGFVEQDPVSGKYGIGAGLTALEPSYVDVHELRSRALNWCDSLAAHACATVRIGTHDHGEVRVVHHVFRPDNSVQTLEVGARLPLHACALGKALLAYDPGAVAMLHEGELEPCTWRTIVRPRALGKALERVREQGWAGEIEELATGQAGIAAPIHGPGGVVVGAVGLTGPISDLCDADAQPHPALAAMVVETAHAVARELAARR